MPGLVPGIHVIPGTPDDVDGRNKPGHGEQERQRRQPDRRQVALGVVDAVIAEYCGEPVAHTGVDGCGAPAAVISLAGLARGIDAVAHHLIEVDEFTIEIVDPCSGRLEREKHRAATDEGFIKTPRGIRRQGGVDMRQELALPARPFDQWLNVFHR